MLHKKPLYTLGILIILLLSTPLLTNLITGRATTVSLSSAPKLTGQVAQALATTNGTVPVAGKDFTLQNINYFDNNSWVVATVKPASNQFDPGTVVLQNKQGIYQVALGPGSAFPRASVQALPPDVANYLQKQGVVYGPVIQQ